MLIAVFITEMVILHKYVYLLLLLLLLLFNAMFSLELPSVMRTKQFVSMVT